MFGYIRGAKCDYHSNRGMIIIVTSPPFTRKLLFNILETWCWFPTFLDGYSKTNKILKIYVKIFAP